MQINAGLNERAVVNSAELDWVPSPMPGVYRRMIERDGDEVARVTSVVRYDPDSRFSAHVHTGGEEYLVLDGTFSDQYGDFPKGTYVRNPVGSKHAPHTDGGCTILVKLWWMHGEDQEFVRTNIEDLDLYSETCTPGIRSLNLHSYERAEESVVIIDAGATLPTRDLPGGEEFYVIKGSCEDRYGTYGTGHWVRTPVGSAPELSSTDGCRLLMTQGHLLNPPPGPSGEMR